MRPAALIALVFLVPDVTPKGPNIWETRWAQGDFVAAANEPLVRHVDAGEAVGIKISGIGESCLLRRRIFPLSLPCRLKFRVRWTECLQDHAFPSLHVIFDPPAIETDWWKDPITAHVGRWRDGIKNFTFHFSTNRDWRHVGVSDWLETAGDQHGYSSERGTWVNLEIRLEKTRAAVFAEGRKVAECEVELSVFRTFTYGIGDQTSTFVELDEFRYTQSR